MEVRSPDCQIFGAGFSRQDGQDARCHGPPKRMPQWSASRAGMPRPFAQEHRENGASTVGDFSGTFHPPTPRFAQFCSVFVTVTEKPQNAKSPAIARLLLVGARGFEPPTPSLPVRYSRSIILSCFQSVGQLYSSDFGTFFGTSVRDPVPMPPPHPRRERTSWLS
jgi:hypothetical protein